MSRRPSLNFTESPGESRLVSRRALARIHHGRAAERKPLKVELPQAPKGAKWADPPKLIDRLVYRVDGEGYLPQSFTHLFVVAADGGAARQLTHGDFDHHGPPAWSADGTVSISPPIAARTPTMSRSTARSTA